MMCLEGCFYFSYYHFFFSPMYFFGLTSTVSIYASNSNLFFFSSEQVNSGDLVCNTFPFVCSSNSWWKPFCSVQNTCQNWLRKSKKGIKQKKMSVVRNNNIYMKQASLKRNNGFNVIKLFGNKCAHLSEIGKRYNIHIRIKTEPQKSTHM